MSEHLQIKASLEDKVLLTVSDFSQLTGISKAGFYTLLSEGKGPSIVKIGRRTRITRFEFEKWVNCLSQDLIKDSNYDS